MRAKQMMAAATVVGVLGIGTTALAGGYEWKARPMLGANEVPANASTASARASFELDDGVIEYKIKMRTPITGAFMAHIHANVVGKNGPIVVWLFGDAALGGGNPTIDFRKGATVARGEITAADLTGPLAGKTLADLKALLDSGGAYVNLHTRSFPGGEIRAQVVADADQD